MAPLAFDFRGFCVQVCNMEVLSEVQSVADQLVASGKPIRCAQQANLSLALLTPPRPWCCLLISGSLT